MKKIISIIAIAICASTIWGRSYKVTSWPTESETKGTDTVYVAKDTVKSVLLSSTVRAGFILPDGDSEKQMERHCQTFAL